MLVELEKKITSSKYFSSAFRYMPGMLVLIFGMLTLYFSQIVIDDHRKFTEFSQYKSREIIELEKSYHDLQKAFFYGISATPAMDMEAVRRPFREFKRRHTAVLEAMGPAERDGVSARYAFIMENITAVMPRIEQSITRLENLQTKEDAALLLADIEDIDRRIEGLWGVLYSKSRAQMVLKNLEKRERWMYWSIITLAFCSFMLIILNSAQFKELSNADEERRERIKLLSDRLAAMETTHDGIGIVDINANLTYMNRALRELHEIAPDKQDDFIGKPWFMLYNEKGREDIKTKVMPILEAQGFWRGESPVVGQSGRVAIAELSLTKLADGGFIGTARDITDKKNTEREKEHLQSQFYQAQKMEAVGRLAGGIAHDFNNIIAAINGFAEFLIDDLGRETPQHKYAQNILQAGLHARDLVNQILAFSRHNDGNIETLDLGVSVDESVAILSASLPKTIEVSKNIETDAALIKGNPTQISQVIMNLCVNAKDAMESEHGTLSIRLRAIDPAAYADMDIVKDSIPDMNYAPPIRIADVSPSRTRLVMGFLSSRHRYVALSVRDTGTGMSRLVMEHIFEPFFTTKPVDKGTGLGLSTVHGVITRHQGAMIVDSTVGEGTTFEIFFPVSEGMESAIAAANAQVLTSEGGNVLLAEDQPEVRDMMMVMLERMGFTVTCCSTGLEALESVRESLEDYDLVIADHNMPKMTGLELAYQVHMDFPDLPFILVSGYSQQQLQNLMEDHPAIKAVLKKPVSRNVLAQKIHSVLAEKKKNAA